MSDLNMYQARNEQYKIISNRIKILNKNGLGKRFTHKDQKHLINIKGLDTFDPFDPIRCKLRVMPINRAPPVQGKTSDYYFV